MSESDDRRASPGDAIGPILGGVAAFLASYLSQVTTIIGAAILAGLGSILGWGLQALFTHRHKAIPATLTVLALIGGGVTLVALPGAHNAPEAAPPSSSSSTSTPGPGQTAIVPVQATTTLAIPAQTMAFTAVPADQAPPDIDGLTGEARTDYGDPQRLSIVHMAYNDDQDRSNSSDVDAFQGTTAIAAAQSQWEWFAAGNSGDLHTTPVTTGDVHCALHDQDNGNTRAECWRWSSDLAVVVSGLSMPSDATRYLAPAIEDLYAKIAAANGLS